MTTRMLTAAIAGMALALSVAACSETATNTNTNTANRNTAVVVNANTNTAAHTDNANRREVTRAEYEKDKDRYSREAKESGSKVGQGADDLWLWTKTRAALLSEDNLRDSTINVDVDNAVVTLRGTVASNDQKARAEAVAKGIEGVKSVKNTLAVSASGETKNDNASKKAAGDKKS